MTKTTTYLVALMGLFVFAGPLSAQSGLVSTGAVAVSAANDVMANVQGAYYESAHVMNLEVYEHNLEIYCEFKTQFSCHSYTVEGRETPFDVFKSLAYCHNDSCEDTRNRIILSFSAGNNPCQYYRLKTVLDNGEVHYSETLYVPIDVPNEVDVDNNIVGAQLNLRFHVTGAMQAYHYTIAGANGEVVRPEENLKGDAVDMQVLPAGIYFISFNSANGKNYHYKIIKTADL
jgi:hypothetical protein